MKILMVVHQFLPRHLAGTEVYTYRLAQALQARGHQVTLFFTEIRGNRPQYELTRGDFDGIPYFEAVHNRSFASFRHSYRDPEMERLFHAVLDESRPNLVHLQHLHLHSIGYIEIARRRALPVLYTLHEYMLMCLQNGLLLRPGTILCEGPEPHACARCAATVYPDLAQASAPARRPAEPGIVRRGMTKLRQAFGPAPAASAGGAKAEGAYLAAVQLRTEEIRAALEGVSLFLAPSWFLRERFVQEGMIPSARIVHSDYGFFADAPPHPTRNRGAGLRVGYVGTVSEYKGVHLIVEAFREILEPGIECRIYGDLEVFPDYSRRLLESGVPASVRFMGRIENAQLAAALAELDLLIVPSVWFENSPLTIHEAYLAGVPVLTSNRGGMAELVEHGKSGLHFGLGDAADLRRQILRVLHEPALLAALRSGIPKVKPIVQDAADMETRYRDLLEGRLPAS